MPVERGKACSLALSLTKAKRTSLLVRFASDSPLEGSGFELSVPLGRATASNRLSSVREHRDPMASPAAKASRLTEVPRQDKSGYG